MDSGLAPRLKAGPWNDNDSYSVIPGRDEVASPESINAGRADLRPSSVAACFVDMDSGLPRFARPPE